jgi:predicted ester cyclase
MKSVSRLIRAAFPDWHASPFLLVGEDDLVVELFTATGHHTGEPAMGVEPSGRAVTLQGINVFRVRDGQIVERWGRLDDLGFQAQLGLGSSTIPA